MERCAVSGTFLGVPLSGGSECVRRPVKLAEGLGPKCMKVCFTVSATLSCSASIVDVSSAPNFSGCDVNRDDENAPSEVDGEQLRLLPLPSEVGESVTEGAADGDPEPSTAVLSEAASDATPPRAASSQLVPRISKRGGCEPALPGSLASTM